MMGENRKKGFWLDPRAKLFLILSTKGRRENELITKWAHSSGG